MRSSFIALNMDGVKGHRDYKFPHNMNENLKAEIMKAQKTLDRSRNKSKMSKSFNDLRNPIRKQGTESDFVPYVRNDTTNISDLIEENTIDLDVPITPASSNKISFEPSEMTGRSTQYNKYNKPELKKHLNTTMTVEQILASSCSEKVRCLGNSFRASSSNGSSLPRTADLSKSRTANTTTTDSNPGLSFGSCPHANDSAFSNENFTPAEMMSSKLAAHEKEWEKEYATMPAEQVKLSSKNTSLSGWNNGKAYLQVNDPNFSIGAFFNQRSESIQNIITRKKSPTRTAPIPLVDDITILRDPHESAEECVFYARQAHDEAFNDVPVIKVNDESFRTSSVPRIDLRSVQEPPNGEDTTSTLSLSEIADALNNIGSDESATAMVNKLLARKSAKHHDKEPQNKVSPRRSNVPTSNNNPENKENVDPAKKPYHLSETASFSESILEVSDARRDISNKTRQQTSPRPNNSPSAGENEEFLNNIRAHRSPSKSPDKFKALPTYSESKRRPVPTPDQHKESRKRPFSSLRQANAEIETRRRENSGRRSPSPNPSLGRANSPAPSTRSSVSQGLSPRADRNYLSPTFDNSSVSERRFLVESSSPEYGKISLPSYGLVSRSASSATLGGKCNARCTSQCSSSSEYNHRDGCIPLKSTCLELSWGSTKLRKNAKKSFKIKNWSTKRLVMRLEVTGPGFQLANHEPQNLLTLQAQECRTIEVSFCPTVLGSAVGKVTFKPSCEGTSVFNAIFLYGYGGHANIVPHGICKGPVGSAFLTMGELNQLPTPLVSTFTVYNKGPLTGFAVVLVDSIGLDIPRLRDCIEVKPAKTLIPPEGSVKFRIIFKPRREDMKKIIKKISHVMTLAHLRIVCGDEPTRQRIRNLISKMNNSEKVKISSASLDKVWDAFPNKMDIYDLDVLKEHPEVAHELVSTLRTHEIALTLNHSVLDETGDSTLVFPDADETVMFRTIIVPNPSSNAESPNSDCERQNIGTLKFNPSTLEVDPFDTEKSYTITVRSFFSNAQYFQVESNYKNLFDFTPSRGKLDPGDCVEIEVTCLRRPVSSLEDVHFMVYVNNGKFTIPVKILKCPQRR